MSYELLIINYELKIINYTREAIVRSDSEGKNYKLVEPLPRKEPFELLNLLHGSADRSRLCREKNLLNLLNS